jgi:hypothetical protein
LRERRAKTKVALARRVLSRGRKKVVILATLEFFSMKYERASKFKASNYFYAEFQRG